MYKQTEKQKIEQGARAFMMLIDYSPFTDQNEKRLWELGYQSAKRKWFEKNGRTK